MRKRILIAATCVLALSSLAAWGEVIVPGLASSQLDPPLKGQVLIEELNCAACHPVPESPEWLTYPSGEGRASGLARLGTRQRS